MTFTSISLYILISFYMSILSPMDSNLSNDAEARMTKLQHIKDLWINPFPESFDKAQNIDHIINVLGNPENDLRNFFQVTESPNKNISTAWRLLLLRNHWGITFWQIKDGYGLMQVMFNKKFCRIIVNKGNSQEEIQWISAYKLLYKLLDIGDWIWVQWELFRTLKDELTLFVSDFQILSKSLAPLWEKFHGIEDMDLRLRKRYLDMILNDGVKEMLNRRSKFRQSMREFLLDKWFLEVETPILENITWGWDAKPFGTHHDALDIDVKLRISCWELWQKRLMIWWFEKTFEIWRIFRNEWMSTEHAQDYTQMENYRAFADYKQMMQLTKEMYLSIIDKVYWKRQFTIRWHEVDFDKERPEIDYQNLIHSFTWISIANSTDNEIKRRLDELKIAYDWSNRPRLIDSLWKHCRKNISWPAFLVNIPKSISPLAKSKIDNPELTNRFQIIIAWSEVGNGFSELNDPIDQKERFMVQQTMRDDGDEEAQTPDADYITALEHGMPPTAGFWVSERLFSFLEDKPIREAQYFPLMKPIKKI